MIRRIAASHPSSLLPSYSSSSASQHPPLSDRVLLVILCLLLLLLLAPFKPPLLFLLLVPPITSPLFLLLFLHLPLSPPLLPFYSSPSTPSLSSSFSSYSSPPLPPLLLSPSTPSSSSSPPIPSPLTPLSYPPFCLFPPFLILWVLLYLFFPSSSSSTFSLILFFLFHPSLSPSPLTHAAPAAPIGVRRWQWIISTSCNYYVSRRRRLERALAAVWLRHHGNPHAARYLPGAPAALDHRIASTILLRPDNSGQQRRTRHQ